MKSDEGSRDGKSQSKRRMRKGKKEGWNAEGIASKAHNISACSSCERGKSVEKKGKENCTCTHVIVARGPKDTLLCRCYSACENQEMTLR